MPITKEDVEINEIDTSVPVTDQRVAFDRDCEPVTPARNIVVRTTSVPVFKSEHP